MLAYSTSPVPDAAKEHAGSHPTRLWMCQKEPRFDQVYGSFEIPVQDGWEAAGQAGTGRMLNVGACWFSLW